MTPSTARRGARKKRSAVFLVLTKVTMAFDVVTLPAESSIEMTGCVANSDPARLGTGSVVKTSCVGVPAAVGEKNPLCRRQVGGRVNLGGGERVRSSHDAGEVAGGDVDDAFVGSQTGAQGQGTRGG